MPNVVILDRKVALPGLDCSCGIVSFNVTLHSWAFQVTTTNQNKFICQQPWSCQGGGYDQVCDDFVNVNPAICTWRVLPFVLDCFIGCDEPRIQVSVIATGGFVGCEAAITWSGGTSCGGDVFEQNWAVTARIPIPNEGPPSYCPLPPGGPIEFDDSNFQLAQTCDINTGPGITFNTPLVNSFEITAINFA